MKLSKKLLCASTIVLAATALASCGKKNEGGEQVLRIFLTNAGYKTDWLAPMIEEFKNADWVKAKYPNLEVTKPEISNNQEYVQNKFDGGEKANKFDLLFGMNLFDKVSNDYFLDLTDVLYNAEVPDADGGKYVDRMYTSYVDSCKYMGTTDDPRNGKFFLAPWAGGNISFLYNSEFIKTLSATNGQAPVTTDEFLACCQEYTDKNYQGAGTTTFAISKGGTSEDYINKMFYIWWAQYQGLEGYENFWNGIDDGAISKDIFKQKGRLESLKVFESLLDSKKNYISPNAFQNDFKINQRAFKGGESLFYTCGDWYPSEMSNISGAGGKNYQAMLMRAPILSSITELCDTISDDAELAALVRAIDAEDSSLTGTGYDVSQEDFDKVLEARRVVWSFGSGHTAVIPTYAPGKNVAVDFLRFMATGKGQEVYMEYTLGASLPFKYDLKTKNPTLYNSDKIDPLHRERLNYMNSSFIEPYTLKSVTIYPLCTYGYVNEFEPNTSKNYWGTFSAIGNTVTPQAMYDATIAYYDTGTNWEDAVKRAGLNM